MNTRITANGQIFRNISRLDKHKNHLHSNIDYVLQRRAICNCTNKNYVIAFQKKKYEIISVLNFFINYTKVILNIQIDNILELKRYSSFLQFPFLFSSVLQIDYHNQQGRGRPPDSLGHGFQCRMLAFESSLLMHCYVIMRNLCTVLIQLSSPVVW